MADIRNVAAPALPQTRTPARNDTVRTAQAAFFQAALNGVPATPAVQTATAAPDAKVQPVRAATATDTQGKPAGNLRPGSLLDIKV